MKRLTLAATLALPLLAAANSPYISKVYEYRPAPGQFVNVAPEWEQGDDYAAILAKAEEQIAFAKTPGLISLGAFGGYVVFGFDHPVVNVPGQYDFKVYGNAFASTSDALGGNCEPGIVMVSEDANGNGLPDDPWYELAGSEHSNPDTRLNFNIIYYRPDDSRLPNADPDPDYQYICDRKYIRYTTGDGGEDYLKRVTFHSQSYWPEWLPDQQMEFVGTRLPDNYRKAEGSNTFIQYFFDWGYADNRPNDTDPGFKIDWAVDGQGCAVTLGRIHFVKVYTALSQFCGWLGETSTEVAGAEDLHPDAVQTLAEELQAPQEERWCDMAGFPLPGKPSAPGLYIANGKKVIIR